MSEIAKIPVKTPKFPIKTVLIAEEILKGELPPPFSEMGGNYFYGPTPMEELMLWLQSVIE